MGGFERTRGSREDREHSADRDVGVDVGGTVERIDRDQKRAIVVDSDGILTLLRHDATHARPLQGLKERLVGEDVEGLLLDSVAGRADRSVERSRDPAAANNCRYLDRGMGERKKNPRKVRRGVFSQMSFQPFGRICRDHGRLPSCVALGPAHGALGETHTNVCIKKETDLFFGEHSKLLNGGGVLRDVSFQDTEVLPAIGSASSLAARRPSGLLRELVWVAPPENQPETRSIVIERWRAARSRRYAGTAFGKRKQLVGAAKSGLVMQMHRHPLNSVPRYGCYAVVPEGCMTVRRTIGKLAAETGVTVETIRFYERKGLIDQPRAVSGYRHYDDQALATVRYVKIAQRLGLSLADILALRGRLAEGDGFCRALRDTARRRLARIAGEMAELRRLEGELTGFLERCEQRPSDRPCSILLELGALDAATTPQPAKGRRT